MHFHEFEHIIGFINKINKEDIREIKNFELYPIEIIDGNSLSYSEEKFEFDILKNYFILLKDAHFFEDNNRLMDFKVFNLQDELGEVKIIQPIDNYLREGIKYSTVQISKGPFGCIPKSGSSVLNTPKCVKADDGNWYVKFEKAGLKHEENGEEEEADLYVKIKDKTDPFCQKIEECLKNENTVIEGSIYGMWKLWPFWKKSKAHKKEKLKFNGIETDEWVIKSKRVIPECIEKKPN